MASNHSNTDANTSLDIRVVTKPHYLQQHSEPTRQVFRFAYQIRIENRSAVKVKLLRRYWKITDALGEIEEVEGPGVVGQTPTIEPGEFYQYTSGASFKTPIGFMEGHYTMVVVDSEANFPDTHKVPIPVFRLEAPNALH